VKRQPLALLGLACVSAIGAVAVWYAALHTTAGAHLDDRALQTFTVATPPRATTGVIGVASLADPAPFLIAAAGLLAVALVRRRWLMAAIVPLVLLGANGFTQQLKPALGDLRIVELRGTTATYLGSWPSGHSTAAMSLALCFVLIVGPRLRPLAALLGAGYAIAVGYALVVLGYHLPSDVLGGFLVAATFMLLGASALAALEARSAAPAPVAVKPPAALSAPTLATFALLFGAVVAMALMVRRPSWTLDALQHPIALLAAIGIAALGVALTTGLARVLRS
jgi:membrane-associated phospholipid phosphatase